MEARHRSASMQAKDKLLLFSSKSRTSCCIEGCRTDSLPCPSNLETDQAKLFLAKGKEGSIHTELMLQ